MSDSNRLRVSLVKEDTYGTTPTSPAMAVLETTGQSLRDILGYQQSQTIRNTANVKDLVRLSKSAGGGLPCELVYPVFGSTPGQAAYQLWESLLRTTGEVQIATIEDGSTRILTITSGGNTIVRSGSVPGSWVTDGYAVGDIVQVAWASGASSRWGKVTAVSTLTLTLQLGDGFTWASTVATGIIVSRGIRMTNGTTDRSFSIEIAALDVGKYQVFTGQVVDGASLTVADQAITTANFTFQGSSSTRGDAAISGATYTNPTASPVLDAIGVPHFYLGGNSYACKSFSVELSINAAPRTQVGALGPQSMRRGQFAANGRVQAYFQTFTEIDAYTGNTPSDFWMVLRDSNTSALAISFPQMKWSDISAPDRGVNQDRYIEGSFTAYEDPTEACTMKMFLFDVSL